MTDHSIQSIISSNLTAVQQRIARACERSRRAASEVNLVAVSKYVGLPETQALIQCGVRHLGENRLSVAEPKCQALAETDLTWHWIGQLQSNKAHKVLEYFDCIHSVDRISLVEALRKSLARPSLSQRFGQRRLPVFVEVNIAGEEQKAGSDPVNLFPLCESLIDTPELSWIGLMTMAPYTDQPETVRPVFAALRELRDRLENRFDIKLPNLSMGMSHDFEIAIEEGATDVRIGSLLFEGVE